MQIFNINVPKAEYHKCKDLLILLYNAYHKRYPELTPFKCKYTLKEDVLKQYTTSESLLDLLHRMYDNIKKEG